MSEGVGNYYKNELGIPSHKIYKIEDGVDISKLEANFSQNKLEKNRRELELTNKKVAVMYLGNFANLNPKYLLNIFSAINDSFTESNNSLVNVLITSESLP